MGFDPPAQDAMALQPQPPGRQRFAAMAARFGLFAGSAIFLLKAAGIDILARSAGQVRDHVGGGLAAA